MNEKKIIIDYLTFTSKKDGVKTLKKFLGIDSLEFETLSGRYGYMKRDYFDGINIYYSGTADMGVCVELSGKGCRSFEQYGTGDYNEIFSYIVSNPNELNITRLDLAYDDYEGILDFGVLLYHIENGLYVSRFRQFPVTRTYSKTEKMQDITIYCGSKKSETMFRIYDKRAEQQNFELDHWIRFEIQLRRDRAYCFINLLLSDENKISDLFCQVINNYLRFIIPSETDSNSSRYDTAEFWYEFLQTVDCVSLCISDEMYTETRLEKFVKKQTSGAIVAFISLFGFDKFRDIITSKSTIKLNPKYEELLLKHGIDNLKELFSNDWWNSHDD